METVSVQFRLQAGHNTGPSTTEFYRDSEETGTTTHLEETAPTPVAVEYLKSAQFAGDDCTCLFFPYWATHGGSATTATVLDTSGSYEHIWEGPVTTGIPKAFSMEDQGDPSAGGGTEFNKEVHAVTPERVVISGSRRGLITVAADLRGGKAEEDAGAPTAGTHDRTKLFNFGMVHVMTSATLGQQVTPGSSWFATDLSTDALVKAQTELDGTAYSVTSALQEFSLEMTQGIDLQRSYAPGNVTAAFAGYVPTAGDYIYTNAQQQIELEMVFTQDATTDSQNIVETLVTEYEAGTRRGFELWLVHPDTVGATSAAYYGIKATMFVGMPVSWAEENDGQGERYVRVRYRAGYDTTDSIGWHFAVGSNISDNLGG
jgi:hypothetical protein